MLILYGFNSHTQYMFFLILVAEHISSLYFFFEDYTISEGGGKGKSSNSLLRDRLRMRRWGRGGGGILCMLQSVQVVLGPNLK